MTAALPDPLARALSRGIRARVAESFPDWADRNVFVRRNGRLIPWSTATTPYLREPMLTLSAESSAEQVVIIKPSQWGCSEMANAFVAYCFSQMPTPMLFFQPDIEAAKRYSLQRLGPVLEDCPALRGVLVESKSREAGNTLFSKLSMDGVALDILGGNSPAATASKPAGVVIIDEIDRMASAVGAGERAEGDIYELALNRTITFNRWRKVLAMASPGNLSTSKIEPLYQASDRRRYWVPCPLCAEFFVLDFDGLWWPAGQTSAVAYRCPKCDRAFPERHKRAMLSDGRWKADAPDKKIVGFAGNGLMSPWLSWEAIADRWERAKGKPGKVRVFMNNILGKTYDLHGETRVAPHALSTLLMDLGTEDAPVVPGDVVVLTIGVDLQHDRAEATVFGWGAGEECWHVHRAVIYGDPSGDQLWKDLDAYIKREWTTEHGELMAAKVTCIDTGYLANRVLDFVAGKGHRGVFGVKGARGGEGRRVWPKKPSKASYRKAEFYLVGGDTAKAHIYARLKASVAAKNQRGAGMVHIARHVGDESYLEQLVSEVAATKTIHGHARIVWELPDHKRNEALDCAVYGYAGLLAWKARGRRLPPGRPVAYQPPPAQPQASEKVNFATKSTAPNPLKLAPAEPKAKSSGRLVKAPGQKKVPRWT